MNGELVPLERLPALLQIHRTALAELVDPADVVDAERRLAAITELAKRAGLAAPIINEATFLRAEHLERLAELVDDGQARGELVGPHDGARIESEPRTRLNELGVDKRRVAEGRSLRRTGAIAIVRDDPTRKPDKLVSMQDLLRQAERRERETRLRKEREERERTARAEIDREAAHGIELVAADIRQWRPVGVDAIITDPPYLGDVAPLYRALRDFAVDVLPIGVALAVMTGVELLADVVRALEHEALVYRTTIAWRYDNAERVLDHVRRVFPSWKPVLVYHRGGMPHMATVLRGELTSPAPDKDHHAWGQSLDGFERLVVGLTLSGERICDPFLGGGTTAVAALVRARRFVGCDIDPEAIRTTSERLGL